MLRERLKWMAVWMAMAVFVLGAIRYVPEVVSVTTSVDGREMPICSVDTAREQVALSFDPVRGEGDPEETYEILKILEDRGVEATFFVTGVWVEEHPHEVEAIHDAGHDLGNLGESYRDMTGLTREEIAAGLAGVHRRVKELTGIEMELFRPPLGVFDDEIIRTAGESGYHTVQWSVDSMDWKDHGADAIVETVCTHEDLGNGAIILCHNGAKYTVQALDPLLARLSSQGYEVVPVSRLIYKSGFHMEPGGRQTLDR